MRYTSVREMMTPSLLFARIRKKAGRVLKKYVSSLGKVRIVGACYEKAGDVFSSLPSLFGVSPKIISFVDGGLGSQMRQFALGYCISRRTGLPLYLETDFFAFDAQDMCGNKNRLWLLFDTFPKIREAYQDRIISKTREWLICSCYSDMGFVRKWCDYTPELFKRRSRYVRGYYENSRYFEGCEDELRELFSFGLELAEEEKALKQQMEESPNACSVHIRKGDYVGTYFDICSDAYYLRSMEMVHSRFPDVEFYIFSNDGAYARELCSRAPGKIHLIEGRNELDPRVDLYLLTLPKHSIISNSNFSWMGAFLRRDPQHGMTIMPNRWHTSEQRREGVPSDMLKLETWIQVEA